MKESKNIFFLGIGGIGMSALAKFYLDKGACVVGYDKVESVLTRELASLGAYITYQEDLTVLSAFGKDDLFVRTPAVPTSNAFFSHVQALGGTWLKRAELLGVLSKDYTTLAVAGTHGKTTCSTLLAHVLKSSGIDCNAFLGGVARNYKSNYLSGDSEYLVVEADEYDRSFLNLHPNKAIITGDQPDHLDIYGDDAAFKEGFKLFADQVEQEVFTGPGCSGNYHSLSYGSQENADFIISNVSWERKMNFTITTKEGEKSFEWDFPGVHNVENACAVYAMTSTLGVQANAFQEALSSFQGIDRRFNLLSQQPVLVDDYAHHPDELKSLIDSLELMYPDKKIRLAFQPHLFSRTRDFMTGFAEQLSRVDEAILIPIYPAREEPITGVTSEALLKAMSSNAKLHLDYSELKGYFLSHKHSDWVSVIAGAGDIGLIAKELEREW